MNINKILRKNGTYDHIKSNKKKQTFPFRE